MSSEEQELDIPEGGSKYLKGQFLKNRDIQKLKIASLPERKDFVDKDNGTKTVKFECKVVYVGQESDDPDTWTMNVTTARTIKSKFGTALASKWVGKIIPIKVDKMPNGNYVITADEGKLDKIEQPQEQGVLL